MLIEDLIKTGADINITVSLGDLQIWHKEVIEDTRKELELIVLDEKMETYPTVKQVSEILNVDITTLWRWNKKGYLKTIEFGGGRRYLMSEVKALLNK